MYSTISYFYNQLRWRLLFRFIKPHNINPRIFVFNKATALFQTNSLLYKRMEWTYVEKIDETSILNSKVHWHFMHWPANSIEQLNKEHVFRGSRNRKRQDNTGRNQPENRYASSFWTWKLDVHDRCLRSKSCTIRLQLLFFILIFENCGIPTRWSKSWVLASTRLSVDCPRFLSIGV